MDPRFTFTAKVWLWKAEKGAWHFITVPLDLSKKIKAFQGERRGFGSVRVEVTIGESTWKTSIFPEKKGTYVLPLKAAIRTKEHLAEGASAIVQIKLA